MGNNISKNTITSLILQLAITIQGLIIPRFVLLYFGSSINGLVSSLTQYLNLFAVFEGGVAGVILAALYKPVAENDWDKLSSILVSANGFMKKLGLMFVGYALLLATVYPMFIDAYTWGFSFSLTVIISVTIFAQYYFTLIPQLLLRADDKFYLCNIVQLIFIVLNIIFAIASVYIYPEIRFLKLLSSVAFFIQPIVLNIYINKYYKINWKASHSKSLLGQRWDGFGISLANLITTNTDVIVLTAFTRLETVSVYTIYSQVLVAIRGLVNSVSNGFQAQIGQLYAKRDYEELEKKFEVYEHLTNIVAGVLITCCAQLIVSFVLLYTSGVEDVNYNVPLFAFLITLSILFICIREPYIQLTYCAGFFKETAQYAYIEVVLNIVISIVLVIKLELLGVAIGTIISVLYRYIFTIIFIRKYILKRRIYFSLKQFAVEMSAFAVAYGISFCVVSVNANTFFLWIVKSFACLFVNIVVFFGIYMVFYRPLTQTLIERIKSKIMT